MAAVSHRRSLSRLLHGLLFTSKPGGEGALRAVKVQAQPPRGMLFTNLSSRSVAHTTMLLGCPFGGTAVPVSDHAYTPQEASCRTQESAPVETA